MLTNIQLKNFKCFAKQDLSLGNLTLLSGLNGAGKSTVLQSMLLLRQSYMQQALPSRGLLINGPLIALGNAGAIFHKNANDEVLGISVQADGNELAWEFHYENPTDDFIPIRSGPADCGTNVLFAPDRFKYLSAERLGPRATYEQSSYQVGQQRQMGSDGRYAVAYLEQYSKEKVLVEMHHSDATNSDLFSETEAWLGEVSPGVKLKTTPLADLNMISIGYGFGPNPVSLDYFDPRNVGFGLSYVLPVLVAILSSKPGGILLIENPEAHLHPRGQAAIGRLLVCAVKAGVQIIVETHSDHLLNGIRVSIRNQVAAPKDVRIHFFSKQADGADPIVSSPVIDAEGRLNQWPHEFFDQWEQALDQLL
jgi:predicted ATPase